MDRLGIDFGYVIGLPRTHGLRIYEDPYYLDRTFVPGSVDSIARLGLQKFGDERYIVSKCDPQAETYIMSYLDHHHFWSRTGMLRDYVYFCRERADKALICRDLGITHFVDDRLEVLAHMTTVPHRFALNPTEPIEAHETQLRNISIVLTWDEIVSKIL